MKVDVEEPYKDVITISIETAIEEYDLTPGDVRRLKANEIVWIDDTALSLSEEE